MKGRCALLVIAFAGCLPATDAREEIVECEVTDDCNSGAGEICDLEGGQAALARAEDFTRAPDLEILLREFEAVGGLGQQQEAHRPEQHRAHSAGP